MKNILWLAIALMIVASCVDKQENDTELPVVYLTYPHDNDVIGGTITISSDAFDNVGVERVRFSINIEGYDDLVGYDYTEPYEYIGFNTTIYDNYTEVTIYASVWDVSGNVVWHGDSVHATIYNEIEG